MAIFQRRNKQNYLEFIPNIKKGLPWTTDEDGIVTVTIHYTSFIDKFFVQLIWRKPDHTDIELDKFGSFVWKQIDGKNNLIQIAEAVHKKFGKEAEPLHPRIAKFFQQLEQAHLIYMKWPKP